MELPEPVAPLRLSDEELAQLWYRRVEGDLIARASLIEYFHPVAKRTSGKMAQKLPAHVDTNDIIQFGYLGLIRAVDGFDPYAGTPFGPYLMASVRSCVLDELRKLDWAPRSLRKRQRDIEKARVDLEFGLGRGPTDVEVGAEVGLSAAEVREVAQKVDASYHRSLEEHQESYLSAAKVARATARDDESTSMWVIGSTFIASRTPREQAVLAMFYIQGQPHAAVAVALGTTEAKVKAMHTELVLLLREIFLAAQTGS